MKPYPSYKDSKNEWIGKIPVDWNTKRITHFFIEGKETVDDKTYPPLSVTMNGIKEQQEGVAKTDNNDNRKKVRKGDFVINSRSDRKGSSGISHRDGSVSVINTVLEPVSIHPKYVHYLLRSYYFIEEFFRHGKGIHFDLWSTKYSKMKNIEIPDLSLQEQKQISNYLDSKTQQIDSLIDKTQQKIELLKEQRTSLISHVVTKGLEPNVEMKDSGVNWIGKIPIRWKVTKLNHVCSKVRNGYVGITRGIMKDRGVKYIQGIHIKKGEIIFTPNGHYYVTEEWSKEHSVSTLCEGDVLVVQTGTIGNVGYVTKEYENSNCHALIIVRIKKNIGIGRFLLYYFLSNYVQSYLQIIKTGEILHHINTKKLRSLNTLIPSLKEQKQIVDYIDQETSKIDTLIEKETLRIELLQEYRQSLISEVVTGKVDVRNEVVV